MRIFPPGYPGLTVIVIKNPRRVLQVAVFPAIAARTTQELKPQQKVILTPGVENILQLDGKDLPLTSLIERLRQQQKGDEKTTIIVNSDKGVPVGRLVV